MNNSINMDIVSGIKMHIDTIAEITEQLKTALISYSYQMEAVKVQRALRGDDDIKELDVTPVNKADAIVNNYSPQYIAEGDDITVPTRIVGIIYVGSQHREKIEHLVISVNNAKEALRNYVHTNIKEAHDRFRYLSAAEPFLISTSVYRKIHIAPDNVTSISTYWTSQEKVNTPISYDDVAAYVKKKSVSRYDNKTGDLLLSAEDAETMMLNKIPTLRPTEEFVVSASVKVHPVYSIMHLAASDDNQVYMGRENGKKRKYIKATSPLIVFVETNQSIKFKPLQKYVRREDLKERYRKVFEYGNIYVRDKPSARTKK